MGPIELMVHFKDLPPAEVSNLGVTIFLRSLAIFIYVCLFACIAHNAYKYVLIKERYKEFSILLFYIFAFILAAARITEYSLFFTEYLMNSTI